MIIGLGLEIVQVLPFEEQWADGSFREIQCRFTARELEYCRGKRSAPEHLAARYAVKLAALKAMGMTSTDDELLRAVEVVRAVGGQPGIELAAPLQSQAVALGISRMLVSLSHSGGLAVGMVVAEAFGVE